VGERECERQGGLFDGISEPYIARLSAPELATEAHSVKCTYPGVMRKDKQAQRRFIASEEEISQGSQRTQSSINHFVSKRCTLSHLKGPSRVL
jgi:hypothetical protein